MRIRCPHCGRMGYLPDHLVPSANSLRCRKCHANFAMPAEVSLKAIEPRLKEVESWRGAGVEAPVATRARENPALLLADGFVAAYEEPDVPSREPGPDDSQYELTIALKDAPGYSSDDWPVMQSSDLEPESPSSDEIGAVVPSASALPDSDPMTNRFIESWIRPLFYVSLGFFSLSVLLIGFLLMNGLELAGGPVLPLASQALVLASVVVLNFVLVGLWFVCLSVVLLDVARNVLRVRDADRQGPG